MTLYVRRKTHLVKLLTIVCLITLLFTTSYYHFYLLSSPQATIDYTEQFQSFPNDAKHYNDDFNTNNNNNDDDKDIIAESSSLYKTHRRNRLPIPQMQVKHNLNSQQTENSLEQTTKDDGLFKNKLEEKLSLRNARYTKKHKINSDAHIKTTQSTLNFEDKEQIKSQNPEIVMPPPNNGLAPHKFGELGRPVIIEDITEEQEVLIKKGWKDNAFNQFISDIISVNRTLPDVRDSKCKNLQYPSPKVLPPTSIVICFHNEAWSVLLRTVHSAINRSPKGLIKEIILVDDYSDQEHLKDKLSDYMSKLKIVHIVRAQKREGLIRARLLGAKVATAPVLTFLDSHCECAEGWLEPLLTRIHNDPTTVVCPVIDVISDKTFEYFYHEDATSVNVGGFDWNLQFNWHAVPEREKKRRNDTTDPLRSPTMAGGLFSIDKAFFEKLGTYDPGFDIWGGENLELSFKTWMCGGTLEIVPCSHVGHVFRSRSPYKWREGVNVLRRNSIRLAEVWMDDYKKYYYDRIGHDIGDYGDISERIQLRENLQCKPFSYYIKEVYPELFVPGEALAHGEIRNEHGKHKRCLDSPARKKDYHQPLGVYQCHNSGGNQYWLYSKDGEIRRDEACVDYAGKEVVLFPCHSSRGNQQWLYDVKTKLIKHGTSELCLGIRTDKDSLIMSQCDSSNDTQRWIFENLKHNSSNSLDFEDDDEFPSRTML